MSRGAKLSDKVTLAEFTKLLAEATHMPENRFHPFVWIVGEPEIGEDVYIGGFSEINARGALVRIGSNCDIASFVSINCADSHKRCIGLMDEAERKDIVYRGSRFHRIARLHQGRRPYRSSFGYWCRNYCRTRGHTAVFACRGQSHAGKVRVLSRAVTGRR
jgi:acetyltransferase-like isoleucine patch superfamily enzyme